MTTSKKSNCLTSTVFSILITLLVSACGGGGDGPNPPPPTEAANVAQIYVSSGGTINAPPNTPYVTITLCNPTDLTNCIEIDNIMVDTGSTGLRVFAQPNNTAPLSTLNLTQQTVSGNPGDAPIAECLPFTQGATWGPIKYATLQIGGNNVDGETASNLPIQVIADPGFTSVPTVCSQNNFIINDVATFGANGVLGINAFNFDCGNFCTGANPSNMYFNCNTNGTNCVVQSQALVNQVPNPIMMFATDNNGAIITLPTISDSGAALVLGTLTFGIDTQSNNASLNANTILLDNDPSSSTYTFFSTLLSDGSFYPLSIFDTGSNGYFFNPATPITQCFSFPGFYCPGTTLPFSATVAGIGGSASTAPIDFNIADASFLFSTTNTAFDDLGGANGTSQFDWGLPFFYGRSVYVAIEGGVTNAGVGPYVGY